MRLGGALWYVLGGALRVGWRLGGVLRDGLGGVLRGELGVALRVGWRLGGSRVEVGWSAEGCVG